VQQKSRQPQLDLHGTPATLHRQDGGHPLLQLVSLPICIILVAANIHHPQKLVMSWNFVSKRVVFHCLQLSNPVYIVIQNNTSFGTEVVPVLCFLPGKLGL